MSKKIVNKFKQTRRKAKPEISALDHKINCERVADMLMNVMERLPPNPAPVSESYSELLAQMANPHVAPVIVNNHSGELVKYNLDGSLEILNSGVAGSVAALNPLNDTLIESTAEDENPTAKMIADIKRERYEKNG